MVIVKSREEFPYMKDEDPIGRLGGLLVISIPMILATVFYLRGDFRAEATELIRAPLEVVSGEFVGMRKWSKWAEWLAGAAPGELEFSGPETGVGSTVRWAKAPVNYKALEIRLEYISPRKYVARALFPTQYSPWIVRICLEECIHPEDRMPATRVTCHVDGHAGFDIMAKLWCFGPPFKYIYAASDSLRRLRRWAEFGEHSAREVRKRHLQGER